MVAIQHSKMYKTVFMSKINGFIRFVKIVFFINPLHNMKRKEGVSFVLIQCNGRNGIIYIQVYVLGKQQHQRSKFGNINKVFFLVFIYIIYNHPPTPAFSSTFCFIPVSYFLCKCMFVLITYTILVSWCIYCIKMYWMFIIIIQVYNMGFKQLVMLKKKLSTRAKNLILVFPKLSTHITFVCG